MRRLVAGIRGRDDDVFVAPQSVEPELFSRAVAAGEIEAFRARHALGSEAPLAIYAGRLVPEKGVGVLLDVWPQIAGSRGATLVLVSGAVARSPA